MTRTTRPSPDGGGLALLTALVQTIGTTITAHGQPTGLDPLGYALLAVSGFALSGRHRSPRATVWLVTALTIWYHLLDYPRGPTVVALLVVAASTARAGRHHLACGTAIVGYGAWVVLAGSTLGEAVTLAAWVIGLGLVIELAVYAARNAGELARKNWRLEEERKRRRSSEERLRIANELHDVLGHHLSLINVRAGIGLHLMDRQPEQARAALETIKQTSAEALREVQSVLNVLYAGGGESAPRAPAPGLDRLDELTHDAGLPVTTTVTGAPRPLPAEIDRAAYRVVREALTNVRRHAPNGTTAAVTIDYGQPDTVVVQIDDDGGGHGSSDVPAADGNGIIGMRERATALGGSCAAGPLPGGGWRVSVSLPSVAAEPPKQPKPRWWEENRS